MASQLAILPSPRSVNSRCAGYSYLWFLKPKLQLKHVYNHSCSHIRQHPGLFTCFLCPHCFTHQVSVQSLRQAQADRRWLAGAPLMPLGVAKAQSFGKGTEGTLDRCVSHNLSDSFRNRPKHIKKPSPLCACFPECWKPICWANQTTALLPVSAAKVARVP